MKPEQTNASVTFLIYFGWFTSTDSKRTDGLILFEYEKATAEMIDFKLDSLVALFFFHFLRELVCCFYKVVRAKQSPYLLWRPWKSNKTRSLRAERPGGLISFDFSAGGMNHLLRCHRLHRPAAPTGVDQRVPGRSNQQTDGSFLFSFLQFWIFCVRMRCISTSMNVTPSKLWADDCRARNFVDYQTVTDADGVGWTKRFKITKRIGRTAVAQCSYFVSFQRKDTKKGKRRCLFCFGCCGFSFQIGGAIDANERWWTVKSWSSRRSFTTG